MGQSISLNTNGTGQTPNESQKLQHAKYDDGVRILLNGCFDLLHPGHYNAFRQAKYAVDPPAFLVAGVHFSAEVKRVKDKNTILTDLEKIELLEACKFVDEIATDIPYVKMTPEIIDKLSCTYAAHGDDLIALDDGTTMYGQLQDVGRLKVFKRTEGISSTALVNKLVELGQRQIHAADDYIPRSPHCDRTRFICSASRMSAFWEGNKALESDSKVVYIDGDFDLLHPGHVRVLKKAREFGDYLIVGVHADKRVRSYKKHNLLPILTEGERAISLLSCRYVDDVQLDAPEIITEDFISALSIHKVVKVVNHGDFEHGNLDVAEEEGKLVELDMSANNFSMQTIIERVAKERQEIVFS